MTNIQLVADECVDEIAIRMLREAGYLVHYISEESPSIKDIDVLATANKMNCLLLTEDKDFGDLVYRLHLPHCGILLVRLMDKTSEQRAEIIIKTLQQYYSELLGAFAVLDDAKLRIRK